MTTLINLSIGIMFILTLLMLGPTILCQQYLYWTAVPVACKTDVKGKERTVTTEGQLTKWAE